MDKILEIGKWLGLHGLDVVDAVGLILTGVIGVALLIPGEQPEKALQAVVDLLKKISRKTKVEEEKK